MSFTNPQVRAPQVGTLQLKGYRLTTAEILYHMPDFPKLLQSYVWQDYDLAPKFPVLLRFLDFWERELDGQLHTVKVANLDLSGGADYRFADHLLRLQ
jgi:uncharacterized protein Usg